MKGRSGAGVAGLAIVAMTMGVTGAAPQAPADRVPVVVELFTSEGCSSCPPADALLSRLAKDPQPGVLVIPLGQHVTYWDQLGWRDPASLQSATERQQNYGVLWGGDRVYTPQAVVDGHEEMVGSSEADLRQSIARAAKHAHATLTITAAADGDRIAATLAMPSPPANVKEALEATFFLTEDDLTTIVKRGENGGRTLHHDAVVRLERHLDRAPGAEPQQVSVRGLKPEWRRDRLHAIVVLSGRRSHQVFGAAIAPLR